LPGRTRKVREVSSGMGGSGGQHGLFACGLFACGLFACLDEMRKRVQRSGGLLTSGEDLAGEGAE
jgi:hypothetical protein